MSVKVGFKDVVFGDPDNFVLIAGPCVLEDYDIAFEIARFLKNLTDELEIPFIFKASYDKANRTSMDSYRGPGLEKGLEILESVKRNLDVPVLSDVHGTAEVDAAARVLDMIQIPAFLCRQTDLLLEVAGTGKPVNIKKGQFLAPWDMENAAKKVASTGNKNIVVTERGTMFGYNNLTVDFRGIKIMRDLGLPVVFDATHSVQLPGGAGCESSGQREFAPVLAKAAVAAGADGIFTEVYKDPDNARCDGPNSLRLDDMPALLKTLKAVKNAVKG